MVTYLQEFIRNQIQVEIHLIPKKQMIQATEINPVEDENATLIQQREIKQVFRFRQMVSLSILKYLTLMRTGITNQQLSQLTQRTKHGVANVLTLMEIETSTLRWTPFFGQDCVKLSYGDHGWEW